MLWVLADPLFLTRVERERELFYIMQVEGLGIASNTVNEQHQRREEKRREEKRGVQCGAFQLQYVVILNYITFF
jgi:hypothetical protein